MSQLTAKFSTLLSTLDRYQIDYIIIGGVCAVLHGVPVNTIDVDIVALRTQENLERLVSALQELQAYYREHPPGRIVPDAQRLSSPGHHLLMTTAGPIDVLGTIAGGRDYAQLLPHTVEVTLEGGLQIRMLDLPTLIQVKQETGRDKDRLALPILRRTLEEIERMQGEKTDEET